MLSAQIASETLAANLKPGVFLTLDKMTVYVESLDKKNKLFKNFFILDQRNKESAVVFSESGQITNVDQKGSFLKMQNGQIHYNPKESNHAVVDFKEYDFMTQNSGKKSGALPIKSLTNYELLNATNKTDRDFEYRLELHKRYQLSLVSFIFLILGVAFGFNVFQRVSKSESLGICIFLAMSYWIMYFIFESMAGNSKLLFYVYVPNIVFGSIGLFWMAYKNDTFISYFKRKIV